MPTINPGIMTWQELMAYKQGEMRRYMDEFGLETLVETGTAWGDTVEFGLHIFKDVYSIELHPERYSHCREKFAGCGNVHLFQGDSEALLPELLGVIPNKNVLFWLDAHATASEAELIGTAKHDFSGLQELEMILGHPFANSVILVDDISDGTWATFSELYRIAPSAVVEMSIARVVLA